MLNAKGWQQASALLVYQSHGSKVNTMTAGLQKGSGLYCSDPFLFFEHYTKRFLFTRKEPQSSCDRVWVIGAKCVKK